ncbi:hypothetical protein LAG90_05215 [Marinilongibacter aquaticus]|uniref:hypothetical protein n=1 Tax=Marinilongibacter aquaticus TaxID=2975157 RepID=UPI0021BD9D61|nr:hypothetical protein [Marinilongibacter aquaticus]UBM60044.1 hypothetical protein LAG90_05215 [Marinilongibacter aquaticus]
MQRTLYDTTQTHENTRKMIVVSEAMEKALDEKAELLKIEVDRLNMDRSLSDQERKGQLAEFMDEDLGLLDHKNLGKAGIDEITPVNVVTTEFSP